MLTIKIKTDNDAFQGSYNYLAIEIQKCLEDVTDKIDAGTTEGNILDTNGNTTGHFKLT